MLNHLSRMTFDWIRWRTGEPEGGDTETCLAGDTEGTRSSSAFVTVDPNSIHPLLQTSDDYFFSQEIAAFDLTYTSFSFT